MDIGGKISDLRHNRKMTAHELAEATGLSQSYISLLEHNKRRGNVEILGRIAAALGVTLGQLFADGPDVGAPSPAAPCGTEREPAESAAERGEGRESEGWSAQRREGRAGIDLDKLYRSGQLHALAEAEGNVVPLSMRVIPVVSRVAAGDPATYTDGEYPAGFAEEFVPAPIDLGDPGAFALRILGDSMSPRFRDGDIVICSPERIPENGDAVVAKIRDEETTCKIFYLDGKNVVLSPVNSRYPAQVYATEEISWIYPVIICQRREKR